jgi:hypothetical protein
VRRRALIVEANGERFRFYYDLDQPEVLHITLRHSTTPRDAIQTFFSGSPSTWDQTYSRFETYTENHGLLWTRHAHDHSVIVISCFKWGDEE